MVLSSPSGAGKTTLARRLLAIDKWVKMSISATTRPAREGEEHNQDYIFVDDAEFGKMAMNDELLEHATVFQHHYGTPRAPVEESLTAGFDVLFDIDWQGTRQLRQKMRNDLVSVFILPPSMEALEERLRGRGLDNEEVIAHRMSKAKAEISHYDEYDYVIINNHIEDSLAKLLSILHAERHRRIRRSGIDEFVQEMIGQ